MNTPLFSGTLFIGSPEGRKFEWPKGSPTAGPYGITGLQRTLSFKNRDSISWQSYLNCPEGDAWLKQVQLEALVQGFRAHYTDETFFDMIDRGERVDCRDDQCRTVDDGITGWSEDWPQMERVAREGLKMPEPELTYQKFPLPLSLRVLRFVERFLNR